MRLGLRVPACAPAPRTAAFLADVEAAGFDFVGIPDSQLLLRDPFVTIALGLGATTRLQHFPAVTNPVTRELSTLAGLALSTFECGPGRFGVILGSGASAVQPLGRRPASVQEMRDAVTGLRRLVAGRHVELGAGSRTLGYAGGQAPSVYIAASGPRMIELAGELADGVLLYVGVHPDIIAESLRLLRVGASRADRDARDLDVMLSARTVLGTQADVQREVRPMCAQWVVEPHKARWLRAAGIDIPEFDRMPPALAALHPDIIHATDWDAAVRATDFLSDALVGEISRALGFFGDPLTCARQLASLPDDENLGVFIKGLETYSLPHATLRGYGDDVIPLL